MSHREVVRDWGAESRGGDKSSREHRLVDGCNTPDTGTDRDWI